MASQTSISVTTGGGGSGSLIISWQEYQAYSDEEYKSNPKIYFDQQSIVSGNYPYQEAKAVSVDTRSSATYDNRAAISIEEIYDTGIVRVFNTPALDLSGIGSFEMDYGQAQLDWSNIEFTRATGGALPSYIYNYTNQYCTDLHFWELSTNIPIFYTNAEAAEYIQYGDNIADAINNNVPSVEGRYFEITNIWTYGTWGPFGYTTGDGAENYHRDVRGYMNNDRAIALYPVPGLSGDKLIYNVITDGDFNSLEYSENGVVWIPSDTFPYDFLYRPRVDELGTFKFALTFYTDRVPIFEDEQKARDFMDGIIDIDQALNFPDISGEYPGSVHNPTGEPDDGTDWGDVYTESFFHNIYLLGKGALREISNKLYDITPGVWDDIKKGLEMYGDNPIESVMSLMYFPIDLSTIFHNVSNTSSIYFGGYQFTMSSHTANKLIYPQGYFEAGSVFIKPTYNNWRDVKTMRIFIDLPYCGRYELDPQKYIGKNIKVIYYIDLYSGGCLACLVNGASGSRNGVCLDQFNGVIGQRIPITLTDFSGHANAMINTLLGGGGQAITAGQSIGETGAHAALGAASGAGATIALSGAAAGGIALGGLTAAKTVYGLQMNNINKFNQTRGGSSGMLNQYANQKPTFIFVYPDMDIPSNFNAMYGTPSNASGSVGSFSGYFEADTVKLNMPGATESEKEKARALLMGGVYIQ